MNNKPVWRRDPLTNEDKGWVPSPKGVVKAHESVWGWDSDPPVRSYNVKASPDGLYIGAWERGVGRGVAFIPWIRFDPEEDK